MLIRNLFANLQWARERERLQLITNCSGIFVSLLFQLVWVNNDDTLLRAWNNINSYNLGLIFGGLLADEDRHEPCPHEGVATIELSSLFM